MWETITNFNPLRIGHGVRSYEDEKLITFLKERDIHLEICPTSNVQTDVYQKIKDHKIHEIYNEGVSLSINTDARTISNTTLAKEYQELENNFNWTKAHFLKCNLEAIRHAFTTEEVKNEIRQKLIHAYQE